MSTLTKRSRIVASQAVVSVALLLPLAACDMPGASEPSKTPSGTKTSGATAPALPVAPTVDKIDGATAAQAAALGPQVIAAVTPVLTTYVDQAFRAAQPAYDAFTPGAVAIAQAQATTVTRAGFGAVKQVKATRLNAALEVFAPSGQPAGVTARLDFAFDVDGREATVTGRLLLSPEADGWKIFGFDLSQSVPDPLPATPATPASSAGDSQ